MWALVENDSVSKVYQNPKAITIGDVNYPSNIFMLWSASELEAISIYEVVEDNSNYEDPEYYINTQQSFVYANGVVTASYGPATPKNLDDTTNPDGTVNPGLKSNAVTTQKQQAYSLLQPSDWYVVRKSENGVDIPADWDTWRESIRTTCESQVAMINACTTVPELQALYVYDPDTGTRPLGDFPPAPSS